MIDALCPVNHEGHIRATQTSKNKKNFCLLMYYSICTTSDSNAILKTTPSHHLSHIRVKENVFLPVPVPHQGKF